MLVCDSCGTERDEVGTVVYRPRARCLVSRIAELTARELGLSDAQLARVGLAAALCDVGRDQIPAAILNKRGPLTSQEWAEVRRQPELGAAMLSDPSFDDIRDWVLSRRERVDGTGYPRGLSDEEIPLEARIIAVAESYAAMIEDRPFAHARDHEDAVVELLRCTGSQFDAAAVHSFVRASALLSSTAA